MVGVIRVNDAIYTVSFSHRQGLSGSGPIITHVHTLQVANF